MRGIISKDFTRYHSSNSAWWSNGVQSATKERCFSWSSSYTLKCSTAETRGCAKDPRFAASEVSRPAQLHDFDENRLRLDGSTQRTGRIGS